MNGFKRSIQGLLVIALLPTQVVFADDNSQASLQKLNQQLQSQMRQLQADQQKQLDHLNQQLQDQMKQMQANVEKQILTVNTQMQKMQQDLQSQLQALQKNTAK